MPLADAQLKEKAAVAEKASPVILQRMETENRKLKKQVPFCRSMHCSLALELNALSL